MEKPRTEEKRPKKKGGEGFPLPPARKIIGPAITARRLHHRRLHHHRRRLPIRRPNRCRSRRHLSRQRQTRCFHCRRSCCCRMRSPHRRPSRLKFAKASSALPQNRGCYRCLRLRAKNSSSPPARALPPRWKYLRALCFVSSFLSFLIFGQNIAALLLRVVVALR